MNNLSSIIRANLQSTIDRHPPIVALDTTVMMAISTMAEGRSSYVLVVDRLKGDAVVGIFTTADLVRVCLQSTPLDRLPIQAVMSHPVISLSEAAFTEIGVAMTLFQSHEISHLPILDRADRLVGTIDRGVLTEMLTQQVLHLAADRSVVATPSSPADVNWSLPEVIEDRHRVVAQWDRSARENLPFQSECRFPRPDDDAQAAAERDADGRLIGDAGMLADISDRQPAEERQLQNPIEGTAATTGNDYFPARAAAELERERTAQALAQLNQELEQRVVERTAQIQKSEYRYRALMDGASDAIFLTDLQGYGIEVNYQAEVLFGYSRSEITSLHISQIHPPAALAAVQNQIGRIVQYDLMSSLESIVIRQDGCQVPVEITASLINLDGEQFIQSIFRDITERHQAKLALELEALRRNTIFNASFDGIHIIHRAGNLIECNHRFAQMLGYTLAEIASLTVVDWDAKWSAEELYKGLGDTSLDGRTFETLIRRKDGSIFPVEISRQAMEWQGESAIVCIARDITERQAALRERELAQAALQASEAELRSLFMGMDDLVLVVDGTGKYLKIATTNSARLYAPADLLLGKNLQDFFSSDLAAIFLATIERTLATQQTQECEYSLKIDDSEYWFNARCSPLDDRSVIWVARDVSQAKRDEIVRNKLEEDQYRLLATLEASPDYIRVKDAQGNVLLRNSALKRLQGYDDAAKTLQHETSIVSDHPEWAMKLLQEQGYPTAIATGSWIGETALLDACGREIPVSHLLLVNKSPTGEVKFFSSIMRDIRQQKEYEQRLERSNAELLRATRLKNEFLANMSHELRTPLNAILGLSEGLLEEMLGPINARQKKALATVERSGEHLLSLINDILDVSKIEAGQLELEPIAVSALGLANSSLTFIKEQAHRKQIQIATNFAPNLGNINVDERRMRQVLINLLDNAVKFTPAGGRVTLEVYPEQLDTGAWVLFSVTDTGIGITPEDRAKLFQPFMQIDSKLNRQYEGTGLGLMLVKQIVKLHGGSIDLASEFGRGSCFTVRIPYSAAAVQTIPIAVTNPSRAMTDRSVVEHPLILLVENNQANIDSISNFLRAYNYRPISAKNGLEAIDLAATLFPDLILMDIQMPGIDGLEAMQQIRQNPQLANIPIIALTALAMKGDREQCLAAGASEYLPKPMKLKHLKETIQRLILAK